MIRYILILLSVIICVSYSSIGQESIRNIDTDKLNEYILDEVNYLRKKKRVDSLMNNKALSNAAVDHVEYMIEKEKLTHIQRGNQYKKNPKNRADFYQSGFEVIGENVQYTNIANVKKELKDNRKAKNIHQALAKVLVENWKNSPPHYENMISENFLNTYTEIKVDENGRIYACQLFGGSQYNDKYRKKRETVNYKPYRANKCKRSSVGRAYLKEGEDGSIFFVAEKKKETGFRFAWPWTEGIAADIVLLSQYECDEPNRFNPNQGVRGIPLEPVRRKDFRKEGIWKRNNVVIPLGRVPDYIDEPYQINLTIVSRNRSCGNVMFNGINSLVDIELPLYLDTTASHPYDLKTTDSTIIRNVYFEKGRADKFLNFDKTKLIPQLDSFEIKAIELTGYASVEGNFKLNQSLYTVRTDTVKNLLLNEGLDSSLIVSVSSKENVKAFRESLKNTTYDFLAEASLDSIKDLLKEKALSQKLEPYLSTHRYVEIKYLLSHSDSILVSRDTLYHRMFRALEKKDYQETERIQKKYIAHLQLNDAAVPKNLIDTIPLNKQTVDLKYNFLVYNFLTSESSLNNRAQTFIKGLSELAEITEKNRNINTALTYFQVLQTLNRGNVSDLDTTFTSVLKNRFIHREFKYRALLRLAITHDILIEDLNLKTPPLHPSSTKFYRKAGLTVNEAFSVAAFYNHMNDVRTAYDITRRVYKETDQYENLHFLLFLTGYTPEVNLDLKKRVRYFEYVAKNYPTHFCKYFKSGDLNFQLFDEQLFKDLYCTYCDE